MLIVKHRKIFYFLSIILLAVSVFSIFFWGLKPGIDFTGGSLLSISYEGGLPEVKALEESLKDKGFGEVLIRKAGKDGFIIRMKEVTQEEKNQVMEAFSFGGSHSPLEKTFSNVGPILGKEAIYKSWISIVLVLLAIVFFIAFAFRKVSKPISSLVY